VIAAEASVIDRHENARAKAVFLQIFAAMRGVPALLVGAEPPVARKTPRQPVPYAATPARLKQPGDQIDIGIGKHRLNCDAAAPNGFQIDDDAGRRGRVFGQVLINPLGQGHDGTTSSTPPIGAVHSCAAALLGAWISINGRPIGIAIGNAAEAAAMDAINVRSCERLSPLLSSRRDRLESPRFVEGSDS